jgi:hypothetical protein
MTFIQHLCRRSSSEKVPIGVYLGIAAAISLVALWFMRETVGKSLNAVDAETHLTPTQTTTPVLTAIKP